MTKIDVLVIGRSCLDYIAVVNRFPEENRKTAFEFRLMEGGGQGGTASCCISTLGGQVAYVGKLGDDAEGRFCLKRLQDFGLCTEFVEIVSDGTTPVAYIFITKATGDRTIIYEHNALPKIQMAPPLEALLSRAAVLLLDPETTYFGYELRNRKDRKIKIVYDCERWRDGIEDIMAIADFFIPSSDFLKSKELNLNSLSLSERIIRLNPALGGDLIVTDGENGAFYFVDNRLHQILPPPVNVADTIGAGDNFHAAFALALSKGFDLHRAVKFSVAVASLSCRQYGGRKGVPDWKEAIATADSLKSIPLQG
jgi:sugar/nucleoside kinase (ribokinase family)